jgi:hypothetical protein
MRAAVAWASLVFAVACSNGEDVEEPRGAVPDAGPVEDAGSESPAAAERYAIGGEVSGLLGSVTLQLTAPPASDSELVVSKNGTFRFDRELSDRVAYEVSVSEQPEGEFCVVSRGAGKISGQDVDDVEVLCDPTNPGITGIELSVGELSPAFSPSVSRYRVDVPLWVARLTLEPQLVDSDVDVTLGDSVYRGEPLPFDLMLGQNTLEVVALSETGEEQRYILDIHRAMRVVEDAYGKATIPAEMATLGFSAALDGNRTALGAPGHPSGSKGVNGNEANQDAIYSGAVHVFERGDSGWRQQAFIKMPPADAPSTMT